MAGKKKTVGQELIESMNEALEIARGHKKAARVTVVPDIDVKAVREKLHLSQNSFALRFGFSPATVRNWEQHRRKPEGPARVLLTIIDREPKAVERALATSTK